MFTSTDDDTDTTCFWRPRSIHRNRDKDLVVVEAVKGLCKRRRQMDDTIECWDQPHVSLGRHLCSSFVRYIFLPFVSTRLRKPNPRTRAAAAAGPHWHCSPRVVVETSNLLASFSSPVTMDRCPYLIHSPLSSCQAGYRPSRRRPEREDRAHCIPQAPPQGTFYPGPYLMAPAYASLFLARIWIRPLSSESRPPDLCVCCRSCTASTP